MVSNSAGAQFVGGVSARLFNNLSIMTNDEVSITVFAAVGVTTVVSLVAFVAVYVYLEAVVSYQQLINVIRLKILTATHSSKPLNVRIAACMIATLLRLFVFDGHLFFRSRLFLIGSFDFSI